jgi:predicted RND superfamily exporter protein
MNRSAQAIERKLVQLALFSFQNPWKTLLVAVCFVGIFATGLLRLSVNADLAALLPAEYRSVQDLEVLKEKFGGIGYAAVIVSDGDRAIRQNFARDFSMLASSATEIDYVEWQRPTRFLEEKMLYFLSLEELKTLKKDIDERVSYEKQKRNPLYFDLDDQGPPEINIRSKNAANAGFASGFTAPQFGQQYYEDAEKKYLLLFVKPNGLATNFTQAQAAIHKIERIAEQLQQKAEYHDLQIELTGRFKKRVDQQAQMGKDLSKVSWVALLGVAIYLLIHFVSAIAVVRLLAPLLIGLVGAYGMTGFLHPELNILTAFIGAILLGLGIDHGIHLLTKYQRTTHLQDAESKIRAVFSTTARGVLIASITTIFGFTGLFLSSFKAFVEFGTIASLGLVWVTLAYLTVLPAVIAILPPRRREPRASRLQGNRKSRIATLGITAALLYVLVTIPRAPSMEFESDFAALEQSGLRSYALEPIAEKIVGYAQTPVVLYGRDSSEAQRLAHLLREEARKPGTRINFVGTIDELVAPNQEQKVQAVRSIGKSLRKVRKQWLGEDDRRTFHNAKWMAAATTYTLEDIPLSIRRQFSGKDTSLHTIRNVVLVVPNISMSDGVEILELAQQIRSAVGPDAVVAGESMILADILATVLEEGPKVIGFTLISVALILLILLQNLRRAIWVFTASIVAMFAAAGTMSWFGVQLNYLNIVLIPILFGMAADGVVHLIGTWDSGGYNDLRSVARAIFGSLLTTAFGFGALALADHAGLRSFGQMALAGLCAIFIVTLVGVGSWSIHKHLE